MVLPPLSSPTKKKNREDHDQHHEEEVDDCYTLLKSTVKEKENQKNVNNLENNIHPLLNRSGEFSCGGGGGGGGNVVSDSEESMSFHASRARRQRILSGQRFSLLLHDSNYNEDNSNEYNAGAIFRGISNTPPSSAENELNDASKNIIIDRGSNHINSAAWQARQVRMARLRMNRGERKKTSSRPTIEPEGKVIRAVDSLVACYSDENSI